MPADLPFSQGEFARRLKATRLAMNKAGIDVLVVTDPANMAWLTAYDGWSFYAHQCAIVALERDPYWWGRAQDTNGALRTVWMGADQILHYPERFVQSAVRHPMENLADQLADLGFASSNIGVELDNYYFSAKAHLTLQDKLPNATLLDADGLVNWQRAVKSGEELQFMRLAGRITDKIVEGIFERARPGVRKNALAAEIFADGIRGLDEAWGDYPAIVPLLPSGPDAAAPHLTWDGQDFKSGEATFFEVSGCYRRYHAPISRTVFLGQPPQDMIDAEMALLDGLEAGLEAATAGNRAGDVARSLKAQLKKAGIEREGRVGYPIGLAYPPDWGEHTISLREDDETVLQPGMTFHFMPGLWTPDWGLEITESIVIRESGPAECLCSLPRHLWIKD